jgi:hypothetical protein
MFFPRGGRRGAALFIMIALGDKKGPLPRLVSAAFGIILSAVVSSLSLSGQEKPQEEVTVTAVEVPVRVLLKGQPVRDLAEDDFEVYENGVRQAITHIETISRMIAGTGISVKKVEPAEVPQPKKRTFILIFDIFDYTEPVGEAVDYFFREIFHSGDRVVVITEDQVLTVAPGKTVEEFAGSVKESLTRFKSISTQNMTKAFRDINFEADRLLGQARGEAPGQSPSFDYEELCFFYDHYLRIWGAYRNQYLMPDLEFYKNLIQRVRQIEGEKWAICFQQRELFPKIRRSSSLESQIRSWIGKQIDPDTQARARVIQAKQEDLQRSFDLSRVVSPDAMRELFLSADITFHLILLKSTRNLLEQNWELDEVGADYEDSLRKISEATGGYLGFSNKAVEALREAVELEDFHYLLVYQPKEGAGRKERKIEVKVRREGVDVISLKNYVEPVIPMTISDLRAGGQAISFSLVHYQMTSINGRWRGLAEVKITLFDDQSSKVFEEGKALDLVQKETQISLRFPRLKPGQYFIIIQAVDKVANQTDVYSGMIKL